MSHIHKPILGYEGLYEISTSGKIRNLRWPISHSLAFVKMLEFRSRTAKTSYWRLLLTKDRKQKAYFLHRLIGFAFVPGYKPGLVINHKDGNGLNCAPNNLEWGTQKHNIYHCRYILNRVRRPNKPIKVTFKNESKEFPSISDAERYHKVTKGRFHYHAIVRKKKEWNGYSFEQSEEILQNAFNNFKTHTL